MAVTRNNRTTAAAANPLAALLDQLGGSPSSTEGTTERPKSEFWLNVGVWTKNAEGEDMFIQLQGAGIPLDRLKKSPARRTEGGNQLAQAKNALVDAIEAIKGRMEAGEDVEVQLSVVIHRVAGEAEASSGDASENPLLAGVLGAFQ